jgi:hypothetical protein
MAVVLQYSRHEIRRCPTCQALMRLVGIEPHDLATRGNDDLYTFECGGCGTIIAETVAKKLAPSRFGKVSHFG